MHLDVWPLELGIWTGSTGERELTQASQRDIRQPMGELKATFSTGLEVLQCSATKQSLAMIGHSASS